jgi:hypothetical protein
MMLLADSLEEVRKGWITSNGRHIFIGSAESAKASKVAWDASKKLTSSSTPKEIKEAARLHYVAGGKINGKVNVRTQTPKEVASLQAQAKMHNEEGRSLLSQGTNSTSGLSASDKILMAQAERIGQKMYSKEVSGSASTGLLLDRSSVKRVVARTYSPSLRYGETDYMFKPSTGKGYDVSSDKMKASHADVDGKIYIAGQEGVYVINPKGLPK